MKDSLLILKKPEIYSHDELCYILNTISKDSLKSESTVLKLTALIDAIKSEKDSMAVFFMPKNTYELFSMFQGQTCICNFSQQDVQTILNIVNKNQEQSKIAEHIFGKLKILNDFYKAGDSAIPVPSQASEFIEL